MDDSGSYTAGSNDPGRCGRIRTLPVGAATGDQASTMSSIRKVK